MSQTLATELLPLDDFRPALRLDEAGTIRLADSRVPLDLVVEQYNSGMAPEDMVRHYDSLKLADVHAAIAFYLRHRDAVHGYLDRRDAAAERLRAAVESAQAPVTRDELMARRAAEAAHASPRD
jgi:uncharacterized protein (DUF433 family)